MQRSEQLWVKDHRIGRDISLHEHYKFYLTYGSAVILVVLTGKQE